MPSPLDKTLPSGSSYSHLHLHALLPAPVCTTTCACSTHILLDLSFAMSGSGYFTLLAPAMSKVLSPGAVLDVAPSEVSSSLSVSKETCAFILKNCDIIKPLFRSMTSSFCILIGCQGRLRCPLVGISSIFPHFSVQKGQMSSGFLRDRTLFHQLGTCEYECFCLAGALATDANDRAVLEILAAGKYLRASRFHFCLVVLSARLLDKHHS